MSEDASEVTEPTEVQETEVQKALRLISDAEQRGRANEQEFTETQRMAREYQQLQELKDDPVALVQRLGLQPESLKKVFAKPDPEDEMVQKVKAMEEELASYRAERQAQTQRQKMESIRKGVHQFLDQSKDYPNIKTLGSQAKDLVYERVLDAYRQKGKIISEAEAASEIEKELTAVRQMWLGEQQVSTGEHKTLTNPMAGQTTQKKTYADLTDEEANALFAERLSGLKF